MSDSSLKSINAGMGSLGNAWAELLWARSRVAERSIQHNALRWWRCRELDCKCRAYSEAVRISQDADLKNRLLVQEKIYWMWIILTRRHGNFICNILNVTVSCVQSVC
jgi:hypothetical protein